MRLSRFPLLLLMYGLLPASLLAVEYQPHADIREAARQHILAKYSDVAAADIRVDPAELDRRLHMPRCDQPLESFAPLSSNNAVRQTVGIRCNGKQSWTLYVTVRVEVKKMVAVASRRLERGRVISHGDFTLEKRIITGLHGGYAETQDQLLGSQLKVSLKRGALFSPSQLKRPPEVKRGSQVTIVGRSGGIEVRMSGKALSDGSLGQRIKVENSSSNREIEGRVTDLGTVEVSL